ncbi:hypothetical protein LR004_00330 [Candidatus Gracilibacteria bacterium]|nr:hypothetical protein [Candidatus Gracilibacteria bacterium]
MIKKASHILIILVFIFTIKTSFSISNAFLGDDLGLNLYKSIDGGIIELEEGEYSYEMKGQSAGGTIEDPLNKVLSQKGYGDCKIDESLSETDISSISGGDIELLKSKLSKSCLHGGTAIAVSTINSLQSEIKSYKNKVQQRAEEKAKQTYNISRIGLYADGDSKNSPFDIIQDIKDINSIIFTQSIEYKGENPINDGGFSDYLSGKFKDLPKHEKDDGEGTIESVEETTDILEESTDTPISELDIIESDELIVADINPIPVGIFGVDNTQYACIDNVKSSGLSQEYLDSLGIYSGGEEATSDLSVLIPLDENQYEGEEEDSFIENFDEEMSFLNTGYTAVNDNSIWDCSNFFCITIDFITSEHSVFGGEKMNSIQSIVEKSNEHLKKFVNSSLIQGKMTTNNFELGLRDLKLSEVFSFGMVITKKTPPILNLVENEDKDENPLSAKNIYCKRWESSGGKCIRQNDLQVFIDNDAEAKTIIDSGEISVAAAAQKFAERKAQQQMQSLLNDIITKAIQRNAGLKETEELYVEFLEIERFVGSIQDYSNDLSALVRVLNKIPIHP